MGQVDALKMVDHLRTRLVDLAVSENHVRDRKLSDAMRKVWEGLGEDGGLVSELWVEGVFTPELSEDSLQKLSEEGLFPLDLCLHLNDRDVFPADRWLYNHQSESLRRAFAAEEGEKPAFVITAGTGLGKTEAFLLPMLSDLWATPRSQEEGGMRCLILYPMNALIADQIDRIYQWLQGQDRLTVFHFTSETPENARQANQRGEHEWEPCRMRTREEARGRESHDGKPIKESLGNVPDIVITNYSMLEYMLCRPQDSRFFGPDLRCIILDEAHLYSGTLAAEIMMLLRRVRERCGVSPSDILHVATSATLGGDKEDLRKFASSLFSTDKSKTIVLRGQHADPDTNPDFEDSESPPQQPAMAAEIAQYASSDLQTLTADSELIEDSQETVNRLHEVAGRLVCGTTADQAQREHPATPACFLHASLKRAPLIRKIAEILATEKGNALSLNDLAGKLFPGETGNEERNAAIALLRLAASARFRSSDLPLVPHRLHFLFRAPEGLSVCLNSGCSGPQEHRLEGVGCMQPLGDRCHYCECVLLPVHRCEDCGDWALEVHENQGTSTLEPGYYAEFSKRRTYYLLGRPEGHSSQEVVVDPLNGEFLGHGAAGTSLWKAPYRSNNPQVQQCPTCSSSWTSVEGEDEPEWRRTCRSLVEGRPFAMSVTAETVLSDLPPYQAASRNWKPAEGRRLLCFSDSRSAAARLGPLLTQQHEMRVIRAAMVRCVDELTPAGTTGYLSSEVKRLEEQLEDIKERLEDEVDSMDAGLKQLLERELAEKRVKLQQSKTGTSFTDYAALVAQREEMLQILDRDTAGHHNAGRYGQLDWKKNAEKVRGHVEGIIAKELGQSFKKRISVESVGLLEIIYPGIEKLGVPAVVEEKLPPEARQRIAEIWPDFVALLLDIARQEGCIDWSQETPGREWLEENPLTGRWLTRLRGGWSATRFVGARPQQLRRTFAENVLRAAGCVNEDLDVLGEQILCGIFDQLFQLAGDGPSQLVWLERVAHHQTGHEEDDKAVRILLDRLSVRAPAQLYRCKATGTVWTHSALGWVPIKGCLGELRTISPEQMDQDVRWGRARRDFKESSILSQGLWAEEHSGQLSPQENRRLQDLFKSGVRNILSSTTTMELGIDIGGLNGVLLGNVPPGPANHRQRAGRAGRRSDGSAVVITHARDSEYEREVFHRFGEFLERDLRKPTVFVDRNRIIGRHLHAVLLSEFLRSRQPPRTGTMHAYGRMGTFCGVNNFPGRWNHSSEPKPVWLPSGASIANQFREFLSQLKTDGGEFQNRFSSLANRTHLHLADPDSWFEFVTSAVNVFGGAIEDWGKEIIQLREAWDEVPARPETDVGREMAKANAIRHMVRALCQITVIEWLAGRRFLPRYGFPINLQRLTVRKAIEEGSSDHSEPDERYRLERSSLLALSEYVPGSRVLVGGRVATSRGLRKHWTDSNLNEALGLQYFSLECQEGHIYVHQSPDETCPKCSNTPSRAQQLVFPRFGYTTAGWDKMPLGTDLERIGVQSVCPTAFTEETEGEAIENFAGVSGARIIYRNEADLLVRNQGNGCGFAICTRCGFSMIEDEYGKGRMNLPGNFAKHASVFSSKPNSFCWKKADQTPPVLRNKVLAARELTDMALLEWPGTHSGIRDGVYSFGRALLLAGARCLELDERELGMELMPLHRGDLGIVIYDTSPGGAGHCRELINLGKDWIKATRRILYVDEKHHSRCERACLDCILDFSGQYLANRLNRLDALALLDGVFSGDHV